MKLWSRKLLLSLPLAAAVLLSGCAGGYLLENNVQSFTSLSAMPAAPTYRYERLPSQQLAAGPQLETYADGALQRAGLRRDDANAHYTVQLGARMAQVLSPWATGWDGWGWGFHRHRFGHPFRDWESPWYQREVSVIVREVPSNKVVFESHAVNDGPWFDNNAVFPAMFQAAIAGFPNPQPGPRVVNIQIGGK